MGVVLSTHSTLAPISLASTIIGFVSFAFTLATFLRVFWQNLQTVWAAPAEIHAFLTNLRIELYEERASLRALRRRYRAKGPVHAADSALRGPELDDAAIRTLQDSLKHLIQRFKTIQRKFLEPDARDAAPGRRASDLRRRRRRRQSSARVESGQQEQEQQRYRNEEGSWVEVKTPRGSGWMYDEEADYAHASDDYYSALTLGKRLVWLKSRSAAYEISQALSRIQTRRIARQVGEIAVALHEYGHAVQEMRDSVDDVQGRLSRIVGVRRVD